MLEEYRNEGKKDGKKEIRKGRKAVRNQGSKTANKDGNDKGASRIDPGSGQQQHQSPRPLTGLPLAGLDVDHGCVVLLREVLEEDHVVLLVGVVHKHRLGAHAQHLGEGETHLESRARQPDAGWVSSLVPLPHPRGWSLSLERCPTTDQCLVPTFTTIAPNTHFVTPHSFLFCTLFTDHRLSSYIFGMTYDTMTPVICVNSSNTNTE